jgi:hypothetical protein
MLVLTSCPVCRASLRGDEPVSLPCPRCQSDLGLVRGVLADARALQAQAREALARGDVHTALRRAWAAVQRANEPTTRATLAAALALVRRARA